MLWRLERALLSGDEVARARRFAAELRVAEPYPAHVHPVHKDLRPQRLPAVPWEDPVPEGAAVLAERCAALLPGGRCTGSRFLYYPSGVQMHPHLDPDSGREHWRANVLIVAPARGGVLLMDDEPVDVGVGDAYLFRADMLPHAVTPVEEGERLVWTTRLSRPAVYS